MAMHPWIDGAVYYAEDATYVEDAGFFMNEPTLLVHVGVDDPFEAGYIPSVRTS